MFNEKDYPSKNERVIVTVIGQDRVGIIAGVANALADNNANILDISQTTMRDEFFTMIMLVAIDSQTANLGQLKEILDKEGEKLGVKIEIQHEDVFKYMHRI